MLNRIISEIYNELNHNPNHWGLRFNHLWNYQRKENNIFALASTAFIIKEIQERRNFLDPEILEKIFQFIKIKFSEYKNPNSRDTYNFYPTQPSKHFPNGYLMQYFKHFKLPDDIDDTSLIYFVENRTTKEVIELKKLSEQFCGSNLIYDTWYGKNMPKEQDVCALLNLMYLFESHKLPYTLIDNFTFSFLKESFSQIESNAFLISRHYVHPALIVYHYTRFLFQFKNTPLESLRNELLPLVNRLKKKESNVMFKLVLDICLMKLGQKTDDIILDDLNTNNFYTFIAAPLAPFSNPIAKKLAKKKAFQFFYSAKVHNLALMAEYLSLKQ